MSYRVIVADPPWSFADRKEFRRDNPEKKNRYGVGAKGHYLRLYGKGIMPTPEICGLEDVVQPLAAPDGYLFCWALNSLLPDALRVMGAWGYAFKTVAMFYNKVYPGNQQTIKRLGPQLAGEGQTFMGAGRYLFTCSEQLLLGVRGRPWHHNKGCGNRPVQEVMVAHQEDFEGEQGLWDDLNERPGQVIRVTQPRGTYQMFDEKKGKFVEKTGIIPSRKPEIFQDLLFNWLLPFCGPGQFLEVFATEKKPHWDTAGCAVSGGLDIREELYGLRAMRDLQALCRQEFQCSPPR